MLIGKVIILSSYSQYDYRPPPLSREQLSVWVCAFHVIPRGPLGLAFGRIYPPSDGGFCLYPNPDRLISFLKAYFDPECLQRTLEYRVFLLTSWQMTVK